MNLNVRGSVESFESFKIGSLKIQKSGEFENLENLEIREFKDRKFGS